ncbi:MAG: 2OG-Fe(II) oxygenase [Sphingobium sp.]
MIHDVSLALSGPLAILADDGQLGVWVRQGHEQPQFVELQPSQLALLLQFCEGPSWPEAAAGRAGVAYDANARSLVEAFVTFGLLSDIAPPHEDKVRLAASHGQAIDGAFELIPRPLPPVIVAEMLAAAEACELAGDNPLAAAFGGSRGFGISWRAEAKPALLRLLPWAEPFVERIMAHPWQPDGGLKGAANAYYLNLLVLPPGVGSGLHVDRTLDGETSPEVVSILYLRVPESRGGRLVLRENGHPIALIRPETGNAVHFRGNLTHGVTPVTEGAEARISLVCEQYRLEDTRLAGMPYLEIHCR